MKYQQRNPIKLTTTLGAMLLSSLLLGSCGGGSPASAILNAGIGGTGIVFGAITGFGSVWVNGRRFEIDDSEIIVDGEIKTQNELKIGMVVRLDVDTENGMFSGAAVRVEFDDEIEGPVEAPPVEEGNGVKLIEILGQKVVIDATRTLFAGTGYGYADVAADDILEVNGFRVDDDRIIATYVKKVGTYIPPGTPAVELRGKIRELDVMPGTFKINNVKINYAGAILEVEDDRLADGMFVEIEGIFQSHSEITAVEIEQEDENFGADVDDIDLQGVVSQYVGIADNGPGLARFFVNGQPVDASMAELEPADLESLLQDGLEVEVEGEIVGGVLIAEELELRADTELRTTVLSVDATAGSFVVGYPVFVGINTVTVNTSAQTLFEDETDPPAPNFSLTDLKFGDFVEVEGVEVGDTVSAHTVERRDPNDTKLQGAVDEFESGVSITILGIRYPVDSLAIYQEGTMTASNFFAALRPLDIVELEDNKPADGDADEVELDD